MRLSILKTSASNWSAIMTGPGGSIEIVSRPVFLFVTKFCHLAKIPGQATWSKAFLKIFQIFCQISRKEAMKSPKSKIKFG
jgi:hypothetical protein